MALMPAYVVDGGQVPADMLRMVLWATSSGASGVVGARHLQVRALGVPTGAVAIMPGGAILANRFAGVSAQQSYAAAAGTTTQITIPPTGSAGGRTDHLILRIDDWHYDGSQQPAQPLNALYSSFRLVNTLAGITYPYVPLAKITIPASTGAITQAMITDLREVALPRTQRVVRVNPISTNPAETETLTQTAAYGEWWPNNGGLQTVSIPDWATRVKIRADWMQAYLSAGDTRGNVWVQFGDWNAATKTYTCTTEKFSYNNPGTTSGAGNMRTTISAVGDVYIPSSLRGRAIAFRMFGQKVAGAGARMDQMAGTSLDLLFEEIADPSDS